MGIGRVQVVRAPVLLLTAVLGVALVLLPGSETQQKAAASSEPSPLDQPIAWLQEAQKNYLGVRDLACTLVTRENVRGQLGDENVILMKMRPQPFSVYMRWLSPRKLQNQEVCFVAGRNNNRMRVRTQGITKLTGFVSIDPNDPRVTEQSRHNVLEVGIGNLIEQTLANWQTQRRISKTQVKVADYVYNNRACHRVETIHTERHPDFYAYRGVIYLDKESKLPLRSESFDWPSTDADTDGSLLEMFAYVDLRFNVGLTDQDFSK